MLPYYTGFELQRMALMRATGRPASSQTCAYAMTAPADMKVAMKM
jgi:hypothetical protein